MHPLIVPVPGRKETAVAIAKAAEVRTELAASQLELTEERQAPGPRLRFFRGRCGSCMMLMMLYVFKVVGFSFAMLLKNQWVMSHGQTRSVWSNRVPTWSQAKRKMNEQTDYLNQLIRKTEVRLRSETSFSIWRTRFIHIHSTGPILNNGWLTSNDLKFKTVH